MSDHLYKYFIVLKCNVLARGYFPNPTKIILVMYPQNLEAGEEFGQRHGLKVCMGARCIGGYIGDDKTKVGCLKERTDKCERNTRALRKTSDKYPK